MPVILNNGSEEMFTWLDSNRSEWNKELQSLLKPYEGELECYPVTKEVGKVGNNSPSFIIPVDSSENKQNIANFFGNQKKLAKGQQAEHDVAEEKTEVEKEGVEVKHEDDEKRDTVDAEDEENNAPMPKPVSGVKREHGDEDADADEGPTEKKAHIESPPTTTSGRRKRSAIANIPRAKAKSPAKASDGSQRITNFFNK